MQRLALISLAALTFGLVGGSIVALTTGRVEPPARRVAFGETPQPDPRWSPEDVVRFQMDAMRRAADDPAGFKDCYLFASPANRGKVGPLERFRVLLEGQYAAMIGHREAVVGRGYVMGPVATVLATGVGSDGRFMCFQFTLSQQSDGEFDGCWMTESVLEVRPSIDWAPPEPPSRRPRQSGRPVG